MKTFKCEWCGVISQSKHKNARFCSRSCSTLSRTHRPPIPQDDGTAIVPLTKGAVSIIDIQDAPMVSRFAWQILKNGYVYTHSGGYLHRYLMEPPNGMEVDHINGDRLDNRRSNLRICTVSENRRNRQPTRDIGKGFYLHKASGLYHAKITVDGVVHSLGYYKSPEEAAAAYDDSAPFCHGDFARINTGVNHG